MIQMMMRDGYGYDRRPRAIEYTLDQHRVSSSSARATIGGLEEECSPLGCLVKPPVCAATILQLPRIVTALQHI